MIGIATSKESLQEINVSLYASCHPREGFICRSLLDIWLYSTHVSTTCVLHTVWCESHFGLDNYTFKNEPAISFSPGDHFQWMIQVLVWIWNTGRGRILVYRERIQVWEMFKGAHAGHTPAQEIFEITRLDYYFNYHWLHAEQCMEAIFRDYQVSF